MDIAERLRVALEHADFECNDDKFKNVTCYRTMPPSIRSPFIFNNSVFKAPCHDPLCRVPLHNRVNISATNSYMKLMPNGDVEVSYATGRVKVTIAHTLVHDKSDKPLLIHFSK